jgi:hypothetical protein
MEHCKCGAPLKEIHVPERAVICSRTFRLPCATAPLAAQDAGLTDAEWSRRRAQAWTRFMDAQEECAAAAAHYADVCFRGAVAPKYVASPHDVSPYHTSAAAPLPQADGSAS